MYTVMSSLYWHSNHFCESHMTHLLTSMKEALMYSFWFPEYPGIDLRTIRLWSSKHWKNSNLIVSVSYTHTTGYNIHAVIFLNRFRCWLDPVLPTRKNFPLSQLSSACIIVKWIIVPYLALDALLRVSRTWSSYHWLTWYWLMNPLLFKACILATYSPKSSLFTALVLRHAFSGTLSSFKPRVSSGDWETMKLMWPLVLPTVLLISIPYLRNTINAQD